MAKSGQDASFLTLHKVPIYFAEDSWRSGRIGSGLWSTGLALAHYCRTQTAVHNVRRLCENKSSSSLSPNDSGISVLELGSGNGFLAVCVAALATSHPDHVCIQDLVVTDTADHLDQIRETVAANQDAIRNVKRVTVKEHVWGSFPSNEDGSPTPSKFDLIIGSDVAYREHLYDPLIKSIRHYSHSNTVSLIGVTMADTTPEFFERLNAEGFVYQKFADHLLEPEFRGTTFAIFAIRLKNLST